MTTINNTPRRYSVEEYDQMIRKNGNKTFYSHWDLFDFVYGGKKAVIITAKFNEAFPDTAIAEIEAEKTKIKQAIDNRITNGWLKLSEDKLG